MRRTCSGARGFFMSLLCGQQTGRSWLVSPDRTGDRAGRALSSLPHLLTQPRSPTTTGKIERFHRAIRTEFRTDWVFANLAAAQAALDERVRHYNNTQRPHQAIDMAAPAERFWRPDAAAVTPAADQHRHDPPHRIASPRSPRSRATAQG